jgi:hypothetical protein
LAVILGEVSGELTCRDFDVQQAYDQWAADHPNLAATLPTVATARGRHVYFRSNHSGITKLADGELRGGGGYCVLPPSRHPKGPEYHWLIPLSQEAPPWVEDVRAEGFLGVMSADHVTERTEDNRGLLKRTEAMRGCVSASHESLQVDIETHKVVIESLPKAIGQRNRQVFELARALKGMAQWSDGPADCCKHAVRLWHRVGRERGVIGTEPFEETWVDFVKAWSKIKFPKGAELMREILDRVKQQPLPPAASRYEQTEFQWLVGICAELQRRHGDEPFFLSCRTAAGVLDLKDSRGQPAYMKTSRWLFLLEHDGILLEVEKGNMNRRRASRYRYVGGEPPPPQPGGPVRLPA